MHLIYQFLILAGFSFIGELLHAWLPFPVPASVYGLVLLLLCLMTRIVKLKHVEDVASWLIAIMPICFIAPGVKLMTIWADIKGDAFAIIAISFISTIVVIAVTGHVAQGILRFQDRKRARHDQ